MTSISAQSHDARPAARWEGDTAYGIPGFYGLLETRNAPENPDHAEAIEYLDDYAPDVIEELPIKYALGRIAAHRNAAKARIDK